MEVSVKNDLDKLQRQLDGLGKKAFIPALNSVLNKEGNRARTATYREVSKVQKVQQKLLREKTKTRRSNFRTLSYMIDFDVRGITWGRMGPKVIAGGRRGRGVRAGKHRHRHAFVRTIGGRQQVLVRHVQSPRYDGKRRPLRVLRVRLRQTVRREFEAQARIAQLRIPPQVSREISYRVQRQLEKAK